MKKSESDYIVKTYTRYMHALHFMNTDLGVLDQLNYKLHVYTMLHSQDKITQARNIVENKLNAMIKSRIQLFNECYLLQKMMKKLNITIPKIMVGLPSREKEFRLNKMKWSYHSDRYR